MSKLQYCNILGTNINVTNMEDTVSYINEHFEELRGSYICVSNVHTTVMAYENERYRSIQNSAAMALPDGSPLSRYSRHCGFKDAKRVTGPDLMLEILKISPQYGYRHFFYGSTDETLDNMMRVIERDYPDIIVAGAYSPPFRKLTQAEDDEIIDRINETNPDFIWVGLGAPKQEEWMYSHSLRTKALMLGVGAGFDYMAGGLKRAPLWMQKISLEWLYRLMQEPKRLWRRYMTSNIKFFYYLSKKAK